MGVKNLHVLKQISTTVTEYTSNEQVGRWNIQWKSIHLKNKCLVCVEGATDKDCYQKFFNDKKAELRNDNGCGGLIRHYQEILANKKVKYKVIILDRDFAWLEGKQIVDSNVVYTDGHDQEMMCVSHLNVLQSTLNDIEIEESASSVYQKINEELASLSLLKWYSVVESTSWKFKGLPTYRLETSELCNLDSMAIRIVRYSTSCKSLNIDDLHEFCNEKCLTGLNYLEMTNGHDFINRLVYRIRENNVFDIDHNDIQDLLQNNFTIDVFQTTQMYHSLKDWQDHNIQILLNP